jgi:hypothetical protein
MVKLDDFVNIEAGRVAYVLGSGRSCSFFSPEFFADELTIGVNHGWAEWLPRVDYMVTKYHWRMKDWAGSERVGRLVVSKGNTGQLDDVIDERNDVLMFDHGQNRVADFTAQDFPETGLVVSYSTITSAMHFAAVLGASAIVTVGADCGWFDDAQNVGGYGPSLRDDFAVHFELQNRIVAKEIRKRYNIPVMCLLPFVTPNMEGHKFVSPFGALNV